MTTKVYKYGLVPIKTKINGKNQLTDKCKDDLKRIDDILFYSNRYYNSLVELENYIETYISYLVDKNLTSYISAVDNQKDIVKSFEDQIKNERIVSRSKKDDKVLVEKLENERKILKNLLKAYYDARTKELESLSSDDKDLVYSFSKKMAKDIRAYYVAKYNMYWCTYGLIDGTNGSFTKAKDSKYKPSNRRKGLIKFKPFLSEGRIGVRIKKK